VAKKNLQISIRKQHKISVFKGKRSSKVFLPHIPQSHFLVVSSTLKFISLSEVERMRMYLRRLVGKKGKVWSKERTFISLHKKAKGARMGKGIGSPSGRCLLLRKGEYIFEIQGLFSDNLRLIKELPACLRKFSFPTHYLESTAGELVNM